MLIELALFTGLYSPALAADCKLAQAIYQSTDGQTELVFRPAPEKFYGVAATMRAKNKDATNVFFTFSNGVVIIHANFEYPDGTLTDSEVILLNQDMKEASLDANAPAADVILFPNAREHAEMELREKTEDNGSWTLPGSEAFLYAGCH